MVVSRKVQDVAAQSSVMLRNMSPIWRLSIQVNGTKSRQPHVQVIRIEVLNLLSLLQIVAFFIYSIYLFQLWPFRPARSENQELIQITGRFTLLRRSVSIRNSFLRPTPARYSKFVVNLYMPGFYLPLSYPLSYPSSYPLYVRLVVDQFSTLGNW